MIPRLPTVAAVSTVLALAQGALAQPGAAPPVDWVEPSGHRVIRLTGDAGGTSFYFHQNALTAEGDRLVVSTRGGFAVIDLTTLGVKPCRIDTLPVGAGRSAVLGKKTRQLYYIKGGSIYATHIDTRATREVVKLPAGLTGASGLALNADETLLASTGNDPAAREMLKGKGTGNRSMCLFTVAVKTGALKKIHYATDWLNHTQFSPTDPERILFCHEGTWDYVDRIWIIRTDGTDLRMLHRRSMEHEIFGHEFFSADGKRVWYDLQTPRSKVFWLAGADLATDAKIRYRVPREQWSVHYNQSPDGKHFAGDGGGPRSVAAPGNGQDIYLFTPTADALEEETVTIPAADESPAAQEKWLTGKLRAEKLVDLSKHDYKLEPNVTFTPDSRWIVFRSNMHGAAHVYAVEVAPRR
jgi:oligogalacturonide lyase